MVLEQENPVFKAVVVCLIGKKLEYICLKHDALGEI